MQSINKLLVLEKTLNSIEEGRHQKISPSEVEEVYEKYHLANQYNFL